MSSLSHLDSRGVAKMVDVSSKTASVRQATAAGRICFSPAAADALANNPKGDVFALARTAAIMTAKRTADWIPLCHTLPLDSLAVDFTTDTAAGTIDCRVTATATAKTGVEMEAIIGVSAALATLYDMLKAADKSMTITDIRLLHKTGGKSGDYHRDDD